MTRGLEHRHAKLVGKITQLFQGGTANTPAWGVNDPQQCVVVVLIHQQAQVRHNVFDFSTPEERHTATDFVGNTVAHKQLFKQAALVIPPVQNGVIFKLGAIGKLVCQQFCHYSLGFVFFVFGHQHTQVITVTQCREQGFVEDMRVILNKDVGTMQNAPR